MTGMIDPSPPWARAVVAGFVNARSREAVYVPDNPLSHILRVLREDHPGVRTTLATREEEAFGIAAGLYLGGARPTVLLQSSGVGNSINALGSLLLPFEIPVLMIVSMRGEDGEWNAAQTPMGRAVRPVLDALGIPHVAVECADGAEAVVRRAAEQTFETKRPGAVLLPRSLYAPRPGGAT
jgi:sulfopyruvate decarboxylase subunit alpha